MRKILLLFCLLLPIQPAADEVRVPVSGDEIRLSFAPVVKKAGAAVVNIYAKRVIAQSVSPFAGEGSGRYFIQTDAPINPGNSGGALVDMSGRLIGINTSILTRSGGSNGIGFAIPSNLVRQYVAQARAGHRRFVRPWSGIMAQTVEGDLAQALGQRVPEGVLVTALHAASPFRAAGIEPGDVLLAIDGLPVNAPAELEYRLAIRGLGGRVRVSYRRDGSPATAEVDLVAAPGSGAPPVLVEAETPFDGLVAGEVNPRVTAELDLPFDAEGVVVLETRGRSARSGLRPGDVLRAVNGRPIGSAAELAATLSERQRVWQIELLRGGRMVQLRFRG